MTTASSGGGGVHGTILSLMTLLVAGKTALDATAAAGPAASTQLRLQNTFPWLSKEAKLLVDHAVLRARAVWRGVPGIEAILPVANRGGVERRVPRALDTEAVTKAVRDRQPVVQFLNRVTHRALGAEGAEAGEIVRAGRTALDVTQETLRTLWTKPSAIGSALWHLVLRPGVQKWALGVGALSHALKEGALGDKTIVVLVEVQTVLPVHTRSTQPVLTHSGLHVPHGGDYMPVGALRITKTTSTLLKVLANVHSLLFAF